MTQAALTAAVNALLASGQPITAAMHRAAQLVVTQEMYNANSRGAVLALVDQQLAIAGGDEVLTVRGGATVRIPYTALQGSKWRAAVDISGNAYPTTGGSGTGGAILAGDQFPVAVGGNLDLGTGAEPVPVKSILTALIDTPGSTPANWRVI
jgi:hypothetical protein